jgi:hypothetical protein
MCGFCFKSDIKLWKKFDEHLNTVIVRIIDEYLESSDKESEQYPIKKKEA